MTKEEQETAEMDCLRCYNQGYEVGKKDTITKACEWLMKWSHLYTGYYEDIDEERLVKDFKEAMEEQQ